jgi:hypothetical protein
MSNTTELTGHAQLMHLMSHWNMTRDEALRVMRLNNQDTEGL